MKHQKDLLPIISSDEQAIIETFVNYKNGITTDFEEASQVLFSWSKEWITKHE